MKYLYTIIVLYSLSCNYTSNKAGLEEKAKQYMQDSIVPKFNDPSSYQFVSAKIDTLTGAEYLKNLKRLYIDTDTSLLGEKIYQEKQREISVLSAIPGYSDSVLLLNIEVEYRGKNKIGGLVLDKTELRYYPKEDKFAAVQ